MRFFSVLALGAIMAIAAAAPLQAAEPDGKTLVIARVTHSPKKHYKRLAPIVRFAAEKMKDLGVTGWEVKMASSPREMVEMLKNGEVDWVTDTPFAAVMFRKEAGGEILLRRWKGGVPEYHTVFISRRDSGIESLSGLKGNVIVLGDRGSTSSFFLPFSVMKQKGYTLVNTGAGGKKPQKGNIGYYHIDGDELNISARVVKGMADAGAISNLDWESDSDVLPSFREQLRIFHRSGPVPRAMEIVRGDLDPKIKERLKEILLAAPREPGGAEILYKYGKTSRFDEVTPGVRKNMRDIEKLYGLVARFIRKGE